MAGCDAAFYEPSGGNLAPRYTSGTIHIFLHFCIDKKNAFEADSLFNSINRCCLYIALIESRIRTFLDYTFLSSHSLLPPAAAPLMPESRVTTRPELAATAA